MSTTINSKKKLVRKVVDTREYLMIFSRHPSHSALRRRVEVPVSASIRFGSTTQSVKGKKYKVELNLPTAIECSSDKLLMKNAFKQAGVKTANWCATVGDSVLRVIDGKEHLVWLDGNTVVNQIKFPVVTKHRLGSRGTGNNLHKTFAEFSSWLNTKSEERRSNYIIEQYMNYDREYRVHVSTLGAFYSCRKGLRQDTPESERWRRHSDICVWFLEENEEFRKPANWEEILEECKKALLCVGLDIGAIDLRVQNEKDNKGNVRTNPDYFILETNSAASFAEITTIKYMEHLPLLVNSKI
jgi:glutathione synthase/RimK-type ligase-like ATP-grasp enzyme